MLKTFIKNEFKNILRDKMTLILLIYPVLIGLLLSQMSVASSAEAKNFIVIVLSILTGYIYGAIAGFSILDDRDDNVFLSLSISPISLKFYVWFKILFVFILAIIAGFLLMVLSGMFKDVAFYKLFLISLVSAFQTIITALLINTFANNKVEGFITMKATGFLIVFPIAAMFFLDWKEYLFMFAPGVWAAKAAQNIVLTDLINAGMVKMNFSFIVYIVLGIVVNIFYVYFFTKLFYKKNNI